MSFKYDYDFFVIGGGSGGIRSARWASGLGAKTALVEKDRLGGTCVIRGCIPKKLMVYASSFKKDCEIAKAYGWEVKEPQLNWDIFNKVRDQEIHRLEDIYRGILEKNKVEFISGEGRLKDPHTVEVGGKSWTAKYILIATGGRPYKLAIEGAEHAITSDQIFNLKKQPQSLLVIGSGYIGLEFACIFNNLRIHTSVMFRKDYVLSGFDIDVRKKLTEELSQKNIEMLSQKNPVKIEKKEDMFFVTDDKGGVWSGDLVLMATGRKADIEGLGLKAVGIDCKNSQIVVDKNFKTSCPSVFAVGDCVNTPYQLTPTALNEGMFVSEYLFGHKKTPIDYDNTPSAVFTQPEVATVGLSEGQAGQKGYRVKVYESSFRPLKLTLTKLPDKTYIKLIVCEKTDRVLGCHIIGEGAGEMLQGFAVAIKNKLKKSEWDKTIGIHPTSAEELVTMRIPRENS